MPKFKVCFILKTAIRPYRSLNGKNENSKNRMINRPKLKRLRENLRKYGLQYLLYALSERLPKSLFSYYHSFLMECQTPKVPHRKLKNYFFKIADRDDLDLLEQIGIPKSKSVERLSSGDHCLMALRNNNFAGIAWGTTGKLYIEQAAAFIETDENSFYLYGMYILPEDRLRGLAPLIITSRFDYYKSQNRSRGLVIISKFNKPSIDMNQRIGYENVGEITAFTICGITLHIYKNWPEKMPRLHLTFGQSYKGYRVI